MQIGLLSKRNREVNKVVLIPLREICPNPSQPRRFFDPESLLDLSRSIVVNGLLQPITVRKLPDGGYELIAGERRTQAFRYLGKDFIPAIVEEYTDKQSAVLALIENLQRQDLNFFEEAVGIARLMEQQELTQQQVSMMLGKAQSTVANKLRLLRYPVSLQSRILEAGLTERHARAMLRIPNDRLLEQAVDLVIQRQYNVGQTEKYVEQLLEHSQNKETTRLFVVKDVRIFENSIQKAISAMRFAGIHIENKKREQDGYIEYTIKIPRDEVYRSTSLPGKQTGAKCGAL